MKELSTETTKSNTTRAKTKVIVRISAKAPAASSPEIPILCVLSKAPESGLTTKFVLQEVKSKKWFSRLDDDDCSARYPGSKKKIVDSVIKFARKNLVIKGDIYPAGEGGKPIGVWRITPKGADKAELLRALWTPRYAVHDALIIEEERK